MCVQHDLFCRLADPVPRFQKQSVFNLSGCRFDVAAVLGSEDHQLRSMLPRTTLLDMLRLL